MLVYQGIRSIGPENVIASASDSTGNTKLAREILIKLFPWILNLPDPLHHLSLTVKDISKLTFFKVVRGPTLLRSFLISFASLDN